MVMEREVVCRIVLKDASGKKQLFSGTIYKDAIYPSVESVVNKIKQVFG